MAYEELKERQGAMWDCERLDLPDAGFDVVSSTLRVPSGEDYWDLLSTSYGP